MKNNLIINKIFKNYRKYVSFNIEDKKIIEDMTDEKEEIPDPVNREKERKFLLLLEKNFRKYALEF